MTAEAGGWSGNLGPALDRIAAVATGGGALYLLKGGSRLAFGLPEDREAARVVLNLYQPQRLKGHLLRTLGGGLLSSRLHRRLLPSHAGGSGPPAVGWLGRPSELGRIGFMGCNPSHGLRCILGGLDEHGAPLVAKLGFDRSREAILREAGVLENLGGSRSGVLEVLSLDEGPDWALLRVPHIGSRSPGSLDDPLVVDLLGSWLAGGVKPLAGIPWAADLLARAEKSGIDPAWCARMRERELRPSLLHGDFALWNLRITDGGVQAIDWEWAHEEGVGGVDLAYGLRQEAVLVDRLPPEEAVRGILDRVGQGPLRAYLADCGWEGQSEDWLRLGLLYSHLRAGAESGDLLRVLGLDPGPADPAP